MAVVSDRVTVDLLTHASNLIAVHWAPLPGSEWLQEVLRREAEWLRRAPWLTDTGRNELLQFAKAVVAEYEEKGEAAMIRILPFRVDGAGLPEYNVTTRGPEPWRQLSPMLLGPVDLDWGVAKNVENAWQYSKVYPQHIDREGNVTGEYFTWARRGFNSAWAQRYPMGRGATPAFSLWDGERLDYIEARKRIYLPLYQQAVKRHARPLLDSLQRTAFERDIVIRDFDAYDHRALGYSYDDVLNDPHMRMGHGFVLAMMLES